MKKIGIITICDYTNYGNRLQNYAVQEVLRTFGYEVETVANSPISAHEQGLRGIFERSKKMKPSELMPNLLRKVANCTKKSIYLNAIYARKMAFKEWTSKYIKETNFTVTPDTIPVDLDAAYDYFVVGSDQVWNPAFRNGFELDFLTFAPEGKRVAYAPSFGVSQVPDQFVQTYSDWLTGIPYLSVREEAGAQLIHKLTGRDAVVLVDPTLMISRDKWHGIAKPADSKPSKKYILTYFLGKVSKERQRFIKEIAVQNKLDIVNMASYRDRARYAADPSEFIDYVNSASLLLTDSFHGTIFAILMGRPFVVFERTDRAPSMSSRIDTLLSTFSFEHRRWPVDVSDIWNLDFTHVDKILHEERARTVEFLSKSLV